MKFTPPLLSLPSKVKIPAWKKYFWDDSYLGNVLLQIKGKL